MQRILRALIGLSGLMALTGCITPYPDLTQSRSPCRSEPGGWCDFVRETAVQSYAYAMLSSNSYEDEDSFTALPLAFEERSASDNDESGLAYSVFDRFAVEDDERGKLAARVIAFRGTDFGSTSDIFSGTLGDSQREGARMAYAAERRNLDESSYKDVKIEVTGHSLGGALATQVSIENPDVQAYVFNTSPFFAGDAMMNDNNRVAVAERGEFLRILRRYKEPPAAEVLVINCAPSASAAAKHSIRKLGECLTWIAAYGDKQAEKLIVPNAIAKPEVECGAADKAHPGVAASTAVMCPHSPQPAN